MGVGLSLIIRKRIRSMALCIYLPCPFLPQLTHNSKNTSSRWPTGYGCFNMAITISDKDLKGVNPTVPYQAPAGGYQHVGYYRGYRPHFPPASYGPYQAPAVAGYGYIAPPHKPFFSGVLATVAQRGVMGLFHAFFYDLANSFFQIYLFFGVFI